MKTDASPVFAVLHPDEVGWISQAISTSAATLKNWTSSYRVVHPKRGEIWVRGEARPERLADGGTLWNGYVQNITEEEISGVTSYKILMPCARLFTMQRALRLFQPMSMA
ncbi:MAG: PAS domain-containing protein [Marinagarivorans sp.]|nr:PAS domain-containing protein [Marinagarivorans sp.]